VGKILLAVKREGNNSKTNSAGIERLGPGERQYQQNKKKAIFHNVLALCRSLDLV
jgi:hypothetical protein